MRAGVASHTSALARYLRQYIQVQAVELGGFPLVKSAAAILRELIYNNRHALTASMIVAGWDPFEGYNVYQVNTMGLVETNEIVATGSGAIYC